MNKNLQSELTKVAYINDALLYVKDLPNSPLYKYQEISGMTGYDGDRYNNLEVFIEDLFKIGIDAKGFLEDAVRELLKLNLKDSVTYMLIAEKNKDVIPLLPKDIQIDVLRYLKAPSRDQLTKISFKQDSKKYFDYCLQVIADSQLLIEKKTLGIHTINSLVLSYCGINEETSTELGLRHISKVYATKATGMKIEWNSYQRFYINDKRRMNPDEIMAIATGKNLMNNLNLKLN